MVVTFLFGFFIVEPTELLFWVHNVWKTYGFLSQE